MLSVYTWCFYTINEKDQFFLLLILLIESYFLYDSLYISYYFHLRLVSALINI